MNDSVYFVQIVSGYKFCSKSFYEYEMIYVVFKISVSLQEKYYNLQIYQNLKHILFTSLDLGQIYNMYFFSRIL